MERALNGSHTLLRVFMGESDKSGHNPLYWAVMLKAREMGLAGCTVFRGICGFGASSVVHQSKAFRLSSDLPVVVEIVDTKEHVQRLLQEIEPMLKGALVTEEQVHVHRYQTARE